MIEQDIKIFGLNIGAILFSIIPDMNSLLQTVVLTLSIVYTVLMIYKKIKEGAVFPRMWMGPARVTSALRCSQPNCEVACRQRPPMAITAATTTDHKPRQIE